MASARRMRLRQFLDSGWTLRAADAPDHPASRLSARVPGCVHADLLRAGKIDDPFWGENERRLEWIDAKDWVYRCTFTVQRTLRLKECLELVAEGLDTVASIWLNGEELGRAENMFVAHRFDVRRHVRRGRNVLEITFRSPTQVVRERLKPDHFREPCDPVGGASLLRKQQSSFGWDWAPRLPTSGIWLPIYLEAWSGARIESVRVEQRHAAGEVALLFHPTLSSVAATQFCGTVSLGDQTVATIEDLSTLIPDPQLWWPNGHGEQPLYHVKLELIGADDEVLDIWERRIGLRTITLDRAADEFGESFRFVVNGRPIFAKGANWIPAHSFVSEAGAGVYEDLLTSVAEANMNMIRVWGGGIYEQEIFYDLCDEKGLLVWQDFMFACALYPGDKGFLDQVAREATYQVRRLAHRACLALWCGNNELEQYASDIVKVPERRQAYEALFYDLLPHLVKIWDGVTAYWPSSPHNPAGWEKGHNNERAGDAHFWDVWHARKPVKTYEQKHFRFCSEFGMQSYSSPEVAASYCREKDWNIFGPEMENHQKNGAGNQIIFDYVSRLYRFPRDYRALSFLSQLNQAYCMKIGIEHFRRSMPRTMGALYWQLNDCWPVASWSSLEFRGRWKALHYEARRFFAPALLSIHLPGDEEPYIASNRLVSTIREAHLYTVFDGRADTRGTINWALCHLDQGRLCAGAKEVELRYGESVCQISLDFADEMAAHGARWLYLRAHLSIGDEIVSRQTAFLTAPRYLALKKSPIHARLHKTDRCRYELTLRSPAFQPHVAFALPDVAHRADDNFIDLYPGEPRCLTLRTQRDFSAADLQRRLEIQSLVLTY